MKIQDVLKDKRFSEFSLLAGSSGAGNAISTVTVIDTPDGAKWLSGGEFVITTAYMLKDDEEALLRFIQTLKTRKASESNRDVISRIFRTRPWLFPMISVFPCF